MELIDQIDKIIEVVTSCTKSAFNVGDYADMVHQNYLPPASFEYLKRHWISRECVNMSATWFKEVAEMLEADVGDLKDVYAARAGFVVAYLLVKRLLEYDAALLPGDLRSKIESAAVESLSLDAVVGHVWPIIVSAGVDALYVLKPLREHLAKGGLRLVKRLAAPLAVFGVVSDVLHKSGMAGNYFTSTGFGRLVNRLTDAAVDSKYVAPLLRDVLHTLISVGKVHEEVFEHLVDSRDLRGFAKTCVKKHVKSGELYTVEDAEVDLAHYILAAANHYEYGGAEIRALLRRLRWDAANPQEVRELIARHLFAKLVRPR